MYSGRTSPDVEHGHGLADRSRIPTPCCYLHLLTLWARDGRPGSKPQGSLLSQSFKQSPENKNEQ